MYTINPSAWQKKLIFNWKTFVKKIFFFSKFVLINLFFWLFSSSFPPFYYCSHFNERWNWRKKQTILLLTKFLITSSNLNISIIRRKFFVSSQRVGIFHGYKSFKCQWKCPSEIVSWFINNEKHTQSFQFPDGPLLHRPLQVHSVHLKFFFFI